MKMGITTIKQLKNLSKVTAIVGILFILELILGFNGTLLIIRGVGIRKILYILLLCIVCLYAGVVIRRYGFKQILTLAIPLDYAIFVFLLLQLFWILILPLIYGESLRSSIKEAWSFATLLLYFPIALQIRLKLINWDQTKQWIKYSAIILAIIHITLYLGETIVGDATFALGFFEIINKLALGHSKRPLIMMPAHYIRIIYPVSIYLLMPIYFILQTKKWSVLAITYYGIAIMGIITTLTKSLLGGTVIGILSFLLGIMKVTHKQERKVLLYRILGVALVTLLFVGILDQQMFDGYVERRATTILATNSPKQQEIQHEKYNVDGLDEEDFRDLDELAGTERSNYTRVFQTKKLLGEWQKRPWFGAGYGSYVEGYLRAGDETPYSYEMFLPALLMKLGIIGVLAWGIAFSYFLYYIIKLAKDYGIRALALGYLFIALCVATQFNPFLLNANGMSIILFCLLELQNMISVKKIIKI